MLERLRSGVLNILPAEIKDRPFDLFISLFFIIIILSNWLNWFPPSVLFFKEANYFWIPMFAEIDIFIGSIIVCVAMLLNSYKHRCHYRVSMFELLGWWGIFAGSSALVIGAIALTPDDDMGWPTLVWTINSLAALIKILSPLEDKIKWIK